MSTLKQIFPYSLDGPSFLVFYSTLLIVMALYAYYLYKRKIVDELQEAISKLHIENVYELAYLKGGDYTFYELLISELIEEKKITQRDAKYQVDQKITLNNPVAIYLDRLGKKVVTLEQLYEMTQTELRSVKKKYASFLTTEDTKILKTSLLLLVLFECIGIVRLWQGIQNEKPIGFLGILMLIAIIFQYSLHSWPIRKKQADKYFNSNWEDMHVAVSPYQKSLLTYGFAGISAGTALYHLSPFFNSLRPQKGFSSTGSCDSCGSDCGGGGCGGGCGGCGGCGD